MVSFTYDADGLRLTKVVDGVTHYYVWQGDRLVSESYGTSTLEFFYDESGMPYAFYFYDTASTTNNGYYYYVTNLQGDVVGIRDNSGVSKAVYQYNAWGEDIDTSGVVSDIETINPLRYRGYYFDSESGFYYLQSRYYTPEVGRFINADEFASTGQGFLGYNMFAYCNNNPVNYKDDGGYIALIAIPGIIEVFSLLFDLCASVITICIAYEFTTNIVSSVTSETRQSSTDSQKVSSNIDWDSGDKNHIEKGTGKKHVSGWKRFGIDPGNNNNWSKILPILKDVVDNADDCWEQVTDTGARLVFYSKMFYDEGVNVVVKIWMSADGLTQKLSDAIPYIVK